MQNAFHVGQLVRIVRSSSGCADSRIYCIISLLPTSDDGEQPIYRVKNTAGAERMVNQDEIRPAALTSVP